MEVVRLGYVGAGFMAQKVHLPNFASISNCRLVALAEVRERLGREVAKAALEVERKLGEAGEQLLADVGAGA